MPVRVERYTLFFVEISRIVYKLINLITSRTSASDHIFVHIACNALVRRTRNNQAQQRTFIKCSSTSSFTFYDKPKHTFLDSGKFEPTKTSQLLLTQPLDSHAFMAKRSTVMLKRAEGLLLSILNRLHIFFVRDVMVKNGILSFFVRIFCKVTLKIPNASLQTDVRQDKNNFF